MIGATRRSRRFAICPGDPVASRFRETSLHIHVDRPDAHPAADTLLHPKAHESPISRVVLHESVHYWQFLNHGFLARLADEKLRRLKAFEDQGAIEPPGPVQREFQRRYESVGFSAEQLHESVARFWDIHVIGPVELLELELGDPNRRLPDAIQERYAYLKEKGLLQAPDGGYSDLAFRLAMDASAGDYGRPYAIMRDHYPAATADGLFPIAASMAFQSKRPALFFVRLTHMVAPAIPLEPRKSIEEIWHNAFPYIAGMAARLAYELGEKLDFGVTAYQVSQLADWEPHRWAAYERQCALDSLQQNADLHLSQPITKDVKYAALWELTRLLASRQNRSIPLAPRGECVGWRLRSCPDSRRRVGPCARVC